MKSLYLICAMLVLIGCAGSKNSSTDRDVAKKSVVVLTVKNTMNTSAGIYWQSGEFSQYLGRVKAGKKKRFVIENVFSRDRIKLLARFNWERPLVAHIPLDVDSGKNIVWELSRNAVSWKAKEQLH